VLCEIDFLLTHRLLVYEHIVLGSREKNRIIQLIYQLHSSSAKCARELFEPLKDLASLGVCNEKKFCWFWVSSFCEWRHK